MCECVAGDIGISLWAKHLYSLCDVTLENHGVVQAAAIMILPDTDQLQINPTMRREVARRWSCGELKDVLVAESSWPHPHLNMALNLNLCPQSYTSVITVKCSTLQCSTVIVYSIES